MEEILDYSQVLTLYQHFLFEAHQKKQFPKIHIAILREPYFTDIVTLKKTIESRFTKNKYKPYRQIEPGDIILFKKVGRPISAQAEVEDRLFYDHLTPQRIKAIIQEYAEQLQIRPAFYDKKLDAQYATLIWLKNVKKIVPFNIKKRDQASWVILN
jgi:ASC-1-like (ASCH) protein